MKYRNFICRLIAAVIMVTSVFPSLTASAVEGISFGTDPVRKANSLQTYTTTLTGSEYIAYDTDTAIVAAPKASSETDDDAPVISLSSPYTYVQYYNSSFYLDYEVENASSYEFYSSNTNYATVSSNGYVSISSTYYSYDVTITLRAYYLSDTSKYVEKSVTLYVAAYTTSATTVTTPRSPEIYLDDPDISDLYVGNTFQIDYYADWYSSITWESSDTNVASVDSLGNVTIKGAGEATITAEARGIVGEYVYDSVTLYTYVPIELSKPDESDLIAGNTFAMDYSINYPFDVDLTWSSSDTSVASIDKSGNVTINSAGPVTITVEASGSGISNTDSVTFNVYTTLVLYWPDESDMFVGNTFAVEYSVHNQNSLEWSSSDANIASVDSSGNVTIKGLGTVTISAKAGGYSGSDNPYVSDSVSFRAYDDLSLGTTYSSYVKSGDSNWFRFTAPSDGAYIFESTGNYNTVGELCDAMSQYVSLAYNDDGGTISNFKITYSLTAGQTVYLKVTGYNDNEVSAYNVSVVSDSGQTTDPAIIPSSLMMNPGDTNTLLVMNVPEGSTVQWTSDNTGVVTVSGGVVTAVSVGTATVYALVGNTLCSCKVMVVSKNYIPGDADGNGIIEIADAVKIMCYITDKESTNIEAQGILNGDVYQTGDGLSVQDALAIQKYLAQIITKLPES